MDSPAYISRLQLNGRLLPLAAVIADDLSQGVRHWALILWLGLSMILAGIWFMQASKAAESYQTSVSAYPSPYLAHQPIAPLAKVQPSASEIAGDTIRVQLLYLVTMVVALAASTIPSESDYLAGSILCRGVSRWQYLLGKVASRVILVVSTFLLAAIPIIALATLRLENDLTWSGTTSALWRASTILALLAATSVALGAWFRNPLLAVAVVGVAIFGSGVLAVSMEMNAVSPVAFADSLAAGLTSVEPVESLSRLPVTLATLAVAANILAAIGLTYRNA